MSEPETPLSAQEVASLIESGITQADLRVKMKWNSRTTSRVASRMEKRKLISRDEVTRDGRHTYILRPCPGAPIESISAFLEAEFSRPRGPNLEFVAPSLTPAIAMAVSLRLQGLKLRDIANRMARSEQTIETYLQYARRPEKYYRDRMIQREKVTVPDQRTIMAIRNIMADRGFMFTDETLEGISRNSIMTAIRYLIDNKELKEATFIGAGRAFRIWELYGPLAKRHVVYFEPTKLANYIIETLDLSPQMSINLRQALTRFFGQIFFNDTIVLNTLRQAMKTSS